MRTSIFTTISLIGIISSLHGEINLSQSYSSFIAFGDNLSDDGKFDGTPFEPGLPSFGGRYSNGITFAENIAQDFANSGAYSVNFAMGGATARASNENFLPPQFATFAAQVTSFSSVVADPTVSAAVGNRPLFSVLIGTNDILQNVGLPSDFDVEPGVGAVSANAVEANIRAINSINSNYNDFVVMNLPDLSQMPLFQNSAFGAGALAPLAAIESSGYNDQLALNIDSLRNDGINIIEFDLNSLFQQSLADAQLLGIDTDTPCSFDLSNPGPEGTCVFAPGEPDNTDLSLADNFHFIDGTNPNSLFHNTLADEFRQIAVPEPSSFLMLVVSSAVFAWRRKRKR